MYFAGIDGGQTSSVCVVGDARGGVLARVTGAPADLVGEPAGSTRQADTIDALLAEARRQAGLPDDLEFAAVVAGISGADTATGAARAARSKNVRIVHDSEIAHAGAFGGAPGILIIAGTGSAGLGVAADGRRVRAGGWGYYFGDEGSAVWIARTALRFAMEAFDRGGTSAIEEAALAAFGCDSLREIQHAFARGAIDRASLGSFARSIVSLGGADAAADLILEAAVRSLAELAATIALRTDCRDVSYAGGMFSGRFIGEFGEQLAALRPALQLRPPMRSPEEGALRLALDSAGRLPVH